MQIYTDLAILADFLLEDSFVLQITAEPREVRFSLDIVLVPSHPEYHPPEPGEHHCYRRATLTFFLVSELSWRDQTVGPSSDASGELDYGNIDTFEWSGDSYHLTGDWGTMVVRAESIKLMLL
jgi:hypothetical protein